MNIMYIMLCGMVFGLRLLATDINSFRCSLTFEAVSHLLKEVATRVQGKRLRELDVSRNTSEVDLDLVIRARRRLDVLKVHSGCQCCF